MSLLLSAALAAAAAPAPARFDIVEFFAGRTRGDGQLKIIMRSPKAMRVGSYGEVGPGRVLTLRQTIREEGKAARDRVWVIRQFADGRVAGSLTDAVGPVEGRVDGDRLAFTYEMKGGYFVRQTLAFAPDRRSAANVMNVSKFGMVIATVTETIRKVD